MIMESRLTEMFDALEEAPAFMKPSRFWIELNRKNINQLEEWGYGNFKRTVSTNYFTWLPSILKDPQYRFLIKNLPVPTIVKDIIRVLIQPNRHEHFTWGQTYRYNLLTQLLWDYVSTVDTGHLLDELLNRQRETRPYYIERIS